MERLFGVYWLPLKLGCIFFFVLVPHAVVLTDLYNIRGFISQERLVQTLIRCLSLFLFLHREQRRVQETGAVNHIHRHGDQPAGNAVCGSVLPQQVRWWARTHTCVHGHVKTWDLSRTVEWINAETSRSMVFNQGSATPRGSVEVLQGGHPT